METVELCIQDRERIDILIGALMGVKDDRHPDVLVSCTEAARLLKKSPKTISVMLRDGRLNKVTIGSSTGIPLSDIERLL